MQWHSSLNSTLGLNKRTIMTQFSKSASFKNQPYDSPIEHVAARVVAFGPEDTIFVSGSCVRIARNLYLTARHVLTDFLDKFGYANENANFNIWAIHILQGPAYAIWAMDSFWLSPHSDLAVFHTCPYNDIAATQPTTPSLGLDLTPPDVGSRVVGFGYYASSGQIRIDSSGIRHIEANGTGAATVGEVREVHEYRRDSYRLNFPSYRVNARFDGGMSGGPVTNDRGRLCGIICSNLPPSEEDEEHASYVVTLWPLMGLSINVTPSPFGFTEKYYPFIELAKQGIVHVDDLSKIRVNTSSIKEMYEVKLINKTT